MNSVETIAIDKLQPLNRMFCISYPLEDSLLQESIKRIGVIQPIILFGEPPYTVITGFKRIESAHLLGHATIPALIRADTGEKEALLMAIHDNLRRGLNLVEKALALEKMDRIGFPSEEIWAVMVLLGLRPHEKIYSALLSIARSRDALKAFIVSRGLSMRNVEGLLRFDDAEREQLFALLAHVHTTEGSLREILRMLALMRLKEGRIDFDDFAGAETVDEMRTRLKRRIHPILTSLERRLEEAKQRAALPPNIDIRVDPFFEKEYIDIDIRAKDIKDIEYALERLRKALGDGSLGSMLELTRG
jgi:hypothetical protein